MEMSLAAYATRPLLRSARKRAVVSVLQHPVPARERPGERGCLRSQQCTRTAGPDMPSRGGSGPLFGASYDGSDRGHDPGPAACSGPLNELVLGVAKLGRPAGSVDVHGAYAVANG